MYWYFSKWSAKNIEIFIMICGQKTSETVPICCKTGARFIISSVSLITTMMIIKEGSRSPYWAEVQTFQVQTCHKVPLHILTAEIMDHVAEWKLFAIQAIAGYFSLRSDGERRLEKACFLVVLFSQAKKKQNRVHTRSKVRIISCFAQI